MSSLLGYLEVVYTMVHTSKYIRCTILVSANSIAIYSTLPNELKLQPYHQQTQNHLQKCFHE